MKRALMLLAAMALACGQSVMAEMTKDAPKPGQETQKLAVFAGDWTSEIEASESPFGPAGKYTVNEQAEWFPGSFFLISHSDCKGPMGDSRGMSVMGYDPEKKVYTFHAIDSRGMSESATGTVAGDTWTWTNESMVDGRKVKGRYIMSDVSPTAYSFKYETSTDGGPWTTIMKGNAYKRAPSSTAR